MCLACNLGLHSIKQMQFVKLKTENLRIRFFKLSIQTRWRCQLSCKHVGDKRAAAKKDQKILFSNFSAFLDSF